jgi:glyoxylase-like metal-dependent hydrolase (beta-lactamase superfamily II)
MRRILLSLLAVTTLCGAACRPSLPAVEAPNRTEPQPAEHGVHACWIESRGKFGFTASAILVRHERGNILIDAGNSSHFDDEIDVYHGNTKTWLAVFPGALKPRRPLGDLLAEQGVEPTSLRFILPTHAHLDHLGGAVDLPSTPVLMNATESGIVEHGVDHVTFEVIPAHAASVAPRLQRLEFTGGPYEIFEKHADLFGDGSVVVVPLPGHTAGSVGVFVTLPDGRRVFHVGDAVNDRVQIEDLRGRTPAMRRTDTDRPQAERTVATLHALAEQAPDVEFLPAHERDAWEDVFGMPGGC